MPKERYLITDLHTHNLFSPDSCATPEAIVKKCKEKGITCVAITNHNTIAGAQETRKAAQGLGINLLIITAEEITTRETNPVGKKIELLAYFLEEIIPPGLSIKDTLKEIQNQGAFAGVPHPFELWRHGAGEEVSREIIRLSKEVGIPLLWEVFNSRSTRINNSRAEEFMKFQNNRYSAQLLTIVGSDSHHPREIGRAKLLWLKPWETKEQFLVSLQQANRWIIRTSYKGTDNTLTTLYYRILNRILVLQKKLVSK